MLPTIVQEFFQRRAESQKTRYTQVKVVKTTKDHKTEYKFYNARTGLPIGCPILFTNNHYWPPSTIAFSPNQIKIGEEIFGALENDWRYHPGLPGPVRKSSRGHYWRLVAFEHIVNL